MSGYRGGGGAAWRMFKTVLSTVVCLGAFAAIGILMAWRA